jgi:hypothetical protein
VKDRNFFGILCMGTGFKVLDLCIRYVSKPISGLGMLFGAAHYVAGYANVQ